MARFLKIMGSYILVSLASQSSFCHTVGLPERRLLTRCGFIRVQVYDGAPGAGDPCGDASETSDRRDHMSHHQRSAPWKRVGSCTGVDMIGRAKERLRQFQLVLGSSTLFTDSDILLSNSKLNKSFFESFRSFFQQVVL